MKRIPLPAKTLEEYKTIFGLPKGYDPDKLRKSVDIYLSRYIEGEGKGIGFLFPATSAISYYYFMKGLAKSLFPKAKLKMISPEQRRLDNDELHETSPEVSERAKRNLIPQLKNFAQYFGAESWVAIKFSRMNWVFVSLEDLYETNSNFVFSRKNLTKGLSFEEIINASIY